MALIQSETPCKFLFLQAEELFVLCLSQHSLSFSILLHCSLVSCSHYTIWLLSYALDSEVRGRFILKKNKHCPSSLCFNMQKGCTIGQIPTRRNLSWAKSLQANIKEEYELWFGYKIPRDISIDQQSGIHVLNNGI